MKTAPLAMLIARLQSLLAGARAPGRERTSLRLLAASCALALLAAALAIGASQWRLNARRADQARAQQLRDTALGKLNQAEQEKAAIRSALPLFLRLREQGLIGEENRLAWSEAISQARQRRGLPALTYEIEARQPLRRDAPAASGDYQLRNSRMKLHMDLLHEMDLFDFLDDLKAAGWYGVQDCSIRRNRMAPQSAAAAPLLSADCTLNWLTLGLPGPASREAK